MDSPLLLVIAHSRFTFTLLISMLTRGMPVQNLVYEANACSQDVTWGQEQFNYDGSRLPFAR
jgi:hypothetical protein